MDGNNWRPVQGKSSSMEIPSSDWRSQLQPEARQRIVNKIMDILSRPLPVAVPEGMSELKKIAVRIEEKIYTTAINQSDYLRKISLKMLSMEKKTQQNTQINPQPVINQNSSEAVLPSLRTLDRSPFSQSRFLSMEGNNWRPAQGDPSAMEIPSSDWRSQLQPEARQRIVNKIMDTLRRHLPVAVPEGMSELKKIAVRFEEKIYTAAINQSDYLRKISLKMLSMETKTQQNTQINPQPVNQNSSETVSPGIPPQVNNQVPMIDSIGRQQLLAPNLQISAPASVQVSSSLSNMPNMPGISHSSVNNSLAQGTTTDIYANAQRHVQGRQQQQQSQNPLLYQNQLQPLMKQKVHNNSLPQTSMQQQQQQTLLQTNQLQPSQQSVMQMSSNLTSGQSSIQQSPATTIQSASQSALQQNQMSSIQQSVSSLIPQHVQAIPRQSQQLQSSLHPQTNLQSQQQQLIGQQQANMSNMSNIQPNQLLGQQNNIIDMKQQQQQRLSVQQNNLINMQQSQQLLNQQSLLHQQQLSQQANNMQGLQQQQQQQLLGSIQNISNMQSHQRSMQLLQQSKNMPQTQQQLQQPSMSLLQPQGQQSHHLSSQQQLMSQYQSQTGQLQQPLTMQQQSNAMQREMQQRLQASGALLQSQSAMEQHKQHMQSQRGIPEVSSSTSIDSTAQTGHNGVDWQEEIYQKIQAMKETHLAELQEFHQKISQRFQQLQNEMLLSNAKQSENFEKLKGFKLLLERVISFLQVAKNTITISLKDKLPMYEKQILNLLSSNKKPKMPLQQQGQQQQLQHPGGLTQSNTQHQPSQVLQVQQHDNHGNQVHQLNITGSMTTMQSAVTSNLQHGPMTLPNLAAAQQNVTNSVQSTSDLDQVQANSFGSLQQVSMGSVQQSGVAPLQNSVTAAQQTNLNHLSQSSLSGLQANNITSLQNSNALQHQHLKQQQQEHLLQNQQLKQQLQQRQIQNQLLQQQHQQQRQQLLQPQQQVHLQQKQQQTSQLPVHQMSQHHPLNELNELKARQGSVTKPGVYQPPFQGVQRHNYYPQQPKPGASFPISSPQNLQASSPQISHHSSPQIDQHALLSTLTKATTPIQPTGSPFVMPSPSSPMPVDSEKLVSAAVSLTTSGQTSHQQAASAPLQPQSIAVATPGISASPLLAEFTSQEGSLPNATTTLRASTSERPLERLIKVVQSLSPKALSSAVSNISSVVSMIDRIAGSAPGNGSRAAVGEDLVAMTKCRLQARNFMSQDGGAATKKMKRHTSAMPLNNVSSAGSVNDNFMKFGSLDSPELESTATSHVKRRKLEINDALQEEIREINQQLIDTVVSICDEDSDSVVAAFEGGGEGTLVKCSFSAISFSPNLKAHFASMHTSPIAPLRLLVPPNYPKCSPLLLDKLPIESSKEFEDLSIKAKSRFSISLRCLSQPMSLGEMAGTWDYCARKVIVEYAQQTGGGSFSSTYGAWESCVGA